MEFLPTITCDGDCELYRQFNQEIERRLPDTTIEWKRSHGRPSKLVVVKAQITRLTKDHLRYTIDTTPSLQDLPFYHMFWTDCQDIDEYRNYLKDEIGKWLKKIKSNGGVEWLIIQVNSQGSLKANKPKLQLPRSSVFDKIKGDFSGGKERCIQLWEPSKHDVNPKSIESWLVFMNKLRNSVLVAVDKNLRKFDEKVRTIRDKRTESSWDLTEYFLCHEEVAMIYEMMGLNEDALIQYDEIDALMNQLMNQIKISDHAGCLEPFTEECWCWDGASVSRENEEKLHEKIKKREASLLDLRNYLFIRHCTLLFQLDKVKDILQRMLEFMHNVVHELSILKVRVPEGAAACWVTLTSLQLIRATIQKNAELVTYNLHTAQIYQYARQKLLEVGNLCGLMPDATTTDQQLHIACELSAGIGKHDEVKYSEGNPSNKLKTALSSKTGFQALYLELLQMAIKTYENIKRTRSAKILGIDLGKFYMSAGSYGDAEELLTEGYKMFAGEGWNLLAAQTLVCLAKCQFHLRNWAKYAMSCAVLACQKHLTFEERSFYTEELFRLKDDEPNPECHSYTLRADPLLHVGDIKLHLVKGIATVGEDVHVEVMVNSGLEQVVNDVTLSMVMRMSVSPQDSEPITLSRTDSSSTTESTPSSDSGKSRRDTSSSSNSSLEQDGDQKVKEKFSLDSEVVELNPGAHVYHLHGKVKKNGTYLLQQLVIKMGNLQLLASLQRFPKNARRYEVVSASPIMCWSQQENDAPLVAGLPQVVSLSISTGPAAIIDNSAINVTSASGLLFRSVASGYAVITSESDDDSTETEYSVQVESSEGDTQDAASTCTVILPKIPSYHKIQVDIPVFTGFETTDERQLVVDHDVLCRTTWLSSNSETSLFLTFYKPLVVEEILHGTKYGDFLQVILTGVTPSCLSVSNVNLELVNDEKKLTPFHGATIETVFYYSEVSFVWRLPKDIAHDSEFLLNLMYCSKSAEENVDVFPFKHKFTLDREKGSRVSFEQPDLTEIATSSVVERAS